jgi:hypothetical protein
MEENDDDDANDRKPAAKPKKKRKTMSPSQHFQLNNEDIVDMNQDEMDDIHEGDDDDNDWHDDKVHLTNSNEIPSERQLLQAKRQRRQERGKEYNQGGTHIDTETSLASDGIKIEPFHMREEETDGTGYFDGDTYVFRRSGGDDDDDGEPDAWVDSLREDNQDDYDDDNSNLTKIFQSQKRPVTTKNKPTQPNDLDNLTKEQLYDRILPLVSDSETVAQAIRRYGQLVKKQTIRIRKRNQQQPYSATTSHDNDKNDDPNDNMAKTCLDELTGLSSALLLKGDVNIYDTTRQDILRRRYPVPTTNNIPLAASSSIHNDIPQNNVAWEYVGNQDQQLHGPFTTEQMLTWTKSGYFLGEQRVKIRYMYQQQSTDDLESKKELSTEEDLLADLMDDDDNHDDDDGDKGGDNIVVEPPTKKTKTTNTMSVKGDWMWSSEVNYENYL